MIPVTKPFSPPQNEYIDLVKGIFERNHFTNNGPLVRELESKLKEYLDLENLLFLGNGTIALQIAIKALDLRGEIITTPFSYVATTSSIVWEGCKPVFVDIDANTFNIDPAKIEEAITDQTTAILATHCFGNPCDIDAIDVIAKKYNLKVIYDAAHCFGTKYKGNSIFAYGDVSTTSFHATKLFHTIEGGAVFSTNADIHHRMTYMRNFGHNGPEDFHGVGINGKNSEFHAAMGICNLRYIQGILDNRRKQSEIYNHLLDGVNISRLHVTEGGAFNYAYYPIVFQNEDCLQKVKTALGEKDVIPRRYFFPSLSKLNYVEPFDTPISEDIASRILCLPLYHDLLESDQEMICDIISNVLKN